ncbi:MAG: phosphodiester glycosidase family protein [Patescibacteria group bacterium]|nr:phosphodiester glycosidase family protein [Patescibacteria group bacterium]
MRITVPICSTLIILSLFGAGCSTANTADHQSRTMPIGQVMVNSQIADEQKLPSGFERREISYADGRKVSLIVIPFKSDEWAWSLANDPTQPKSVRAWREMLDADLVINGSYFEENYQPSGYYFGPNVINEKTWPSREQQNEPASYSGLARVHDGKLELAYLTAHPQDKPKDDEQAFLTYPTLLAEGKSLVSEDSKKYARRTILAQDAGGTNFIIITESGATSLYETAKWIADQPEKFQIAINLDGGPSTGLSFKKDDETFEIPSAPIPNVVTATRKPSYLPLPRE